jgi:hypothetical protein
MTGTETTTTPPLTGPDETGTRPNPDVQQPPSNGHLSAVAAVAKAANARIA